MMKGGYAPRVVQKSFILHLIHFSNYFMLINYRKAISVGVMIIRKIPESSENETSMIVAKSNDLKNQISLKLALP